MELRRGGEGVAAGGKTWCTVLVRFEGRSSGIAWGPRLEETIDPQSNFRRLDLSLRRKDIGL